MLAYFELTFACFVGTIAIGTQNSNAPTVDNNVMNVLLASIDTLSRGVAKMKVNVEKLGSDVASTSERLERVESQRKLSTSYPSNHLTYYYS